MESIESYVNYSDDNVIGVGQDFIEGIIKNLKDGTHFDFTMLPNTKKCTVDENMNVIAFEGEDGYIDDGSNGTVVWYVPKFYSKFVPLTYHEFGSDEFAVTQLKEGNYFISSIPKAGLTLHNAFYDMNGDEIDYILMSLDGEIYDFEWGKYIAKGDQEHSILYYTLRAQAVLVKRGQEPCGEFEYSQGTYHTFDELPRPADENPPRLGYIYYVGQQDENGHMDAERVYWNGTDYVIW